MYKLSYWKVVSKDGADELKSIRIKSINEIHPLALPHNRPPECNAVVLERTDRTGQGKYDKLVWADEKGKACEVIPMIEYRYTN